MRNPKDPRTKILLKILICRLLEIQELPSSSALDSPSVLSKFATSPPARNPDMSPVFDDATSVVHDAYDAAMLDTMPDDAMLDTMPDDAMLDDAMPDTALPLGAFLDAHIARAAARCDDTSKTADAIKVEPAAMPDTRYVMKGEIAEDFLAYAQPSNEKDVEIEPSVDLDNPQPKNKRYDKNDFAARKHDMLKMSPYAKYMKDIVTNKRRIPDLEISAMLANYTFKGGTPKKLGRYIIMPSDIYAYWGLAQPQVPVPEPPVEYQTPVYQWEPEELTQQWHPQSTPEYPGAGYFPPWE
ncbi:hypothetical protein ZWY2020_059337 [Hordeum vulgare]|nr:hypothetical protein ZWY2020_059337 [Hordeum vulgare]